MSKLRLPILRKSSRVQASGRESNSLCTQGTNNEIQLPGVDRLKIAATRVPKTAPMAAHYISD
ncbi:MAG: hypothetical protein EHM70_09150 [Chloroflexota bacterium]|nr:MAG: hypothetical protein EHM70_09150 [Chloroflexota bacterium]